MDRAGHYRSRPRERHARAAAGDYQKLARLAGKRHFLGPGTFGALALRFAPFRSARRVGLPRETRKLARLGDALCSAAALSYYCYTQRRGGCSFLRPTTEGATWWERESRGQLPRCWRRAFVLVEFPNEGQVYVRLDSGSDPLPASLCHSRQRTPRAPDQTGGCREEARNRSEGKVEALRSDWYCTTCRAKTASGDA